LKLYLFFHDDSYRIHADTRKLVVFIFSVAIVSLVQIHLKMILRSYRE